MQMFKQGDSSNRQKMNVGSYAPFNEDHEKIWVGFCFSIEKRFLLGVFILKPAERTKFLLKNVKNF